MCGRFALTLPDDAMANLFEATLSNDLAPLPNYNICPTNQIHTVTSDDGQRRLRPMRWGFIPHWYKTENGGPLLINARAETIAEKPAFKAACRERRCLVPATGFYECDLIAFAGVWQNWERDGVAHTTCAIVTTEANAPMSAIHHRMPVTVAAKDWGLWLGEEGKGAATLMHAAPDDALAFYRVDPAVNSNRASGAELIAPLGA